MCDHKEMSNYELEIRAYLGMSDFEWKTCHYELKMSDFKLEMTDYNLEMSEL